MNRRVPAVFIVTALVFATTGDGAITPTQRCEASKLKAAGRKAACRTAQMAKAATGGAADFGSCTARFANAYAKAESKGACPTVDDTASVEARVDADTDAVDAMLRDGRFVDNGDGTVTDHLTGRQWEKKDEVCPGVHCVTSSFTWGSNAPPYAETGTVATDFLPNLNGGLGPGTCLAGHCDWRLPTAEELQSILYESFPCATMPCIAPVFGTTRAWTYWTSTTDPLLPWAAWSVSFANGQTVNGSFKGNTNYVRAVRAAP